MADILNKKFGFFDIANQIFYHIETQADYDKCLQIYYQKAQ